MHRVKRSAAYRQDEGLPGANTGNEAVLRARFEDAQFFYAADLRQPLQDFLPKLAGTQFHKALGSLLEKSERVECLVGPLAEATCLTGRGMKDNRRSPHPHKSWWAG